MEGENPLFFAFYRVNGYLAAPERRVKGRWDTNVVQKTSGTISEPRTNNKVNEYLTIDYDGSGGNSPVTIVHDDNGNLTNDGTYRSYYDVENRLTKVEKYISGNWQTVGEYTYDALGRRVKKVVSNSGGLNGTFVWVWSPEWQLLEIREVSGETETVRQSYVHGGGGGSGQSPVRPAYIDDHVMYTDGSYDYFMHQDAQYNTVGVSGWSYPAEQVPTDPYGKAVVYDYGFSGARATSNCGNVFLHQGLPFDVEKGSNQNRYRELLPTMGRFGGRDPAGYMDGSNLYGYARGAPNALSDSFGLDAPACDDIWNLSVCQQKCCAQHDYCFDLNHCTRASMRATVYGAAAGIPHELTAGPCAECNEEVGKCMLDCLTGGDPNPDGHRFYCGCCHVWFDDPASLHMRHATGGPNCSPQQPPYWPPTVEPPVSDHLSCFQRAVEEMRHCGGPSVPKCWSNFQGDAARCRERFVPPEPPILPPMGPPIVVPRLLAPELF